MFLKDFVMFTVLRRQFLQNGGKTLLNNTSKKKYSNICYCYQLPLPVIISFDAQLVPQQTIRHKSKKSSKQPSQQAISGSETEHESNWDDQIVDKTTRVMQITVKSPRIDGILKSGLGIARNKIETLFYESKIRVNGQKLLKKSELAQEGDEIDIVKGASVTNPNFLTVARVEVLGVTEKGDNLAVKIRRCKNLTIENYDSGGPST